MPRKTDSNNPADWIFIVDSDMEALRVMVRDELGYSMCRSKLAEVLEKILKAELIRTGWPLVKTHDLVVLGTTLAEKDSNLVPLIHPLCTSLAEAYSSGRYPGFDIEDPDWMTLRGQLEQVEEVLHLVKDRIKS